MGSMSIVHWVIVLFVVMLLFGPRRLPELAKGMGEAIREFKKAISTNDQQKPQITAEVKHPEIAEAKKPETTDVK
jgi:sec-independent protein translocase protein TatA